MALTKLSFWIVVYTLINLAVCPATLYFIFKDTNILSIRQTWQNVLTEVFLMVGTPYYFYLSSWLPVSCYALSREKLESSLESLLCPVCVCIWVSLFQGEWILSMTLTGLFICLSALLGCCLDITDSDSCPGYQSDNGMSHSHPGFSCAASSSNSRRRK